MLEEFEAVVRWGFLALGLISKFFWASQSWPLSGRVPSLPSTITHASITSPMALDMSSTSCPSSISLASQLPTYVPYKPSSWLSTTQLWPTFYPMKSYRISTCTNPLRIRITFPGIGLRSHTQRTDLGFCLTAIPRPRFPSLPKRDRDSVL